MIGSFLGRPQRPRTRIGHRWVRNAIAGGMVAGLASAFSFTATQPAHGQLTLTGGGLSLVQEGPAAAAAGDPVPVNLATGAVPFASSDLGPEIGADIHLSTNLNDGAYGNSFSWIGGDTNPYDVAFAGIDLGAAPIMNVQSLAFGRSNVLTGDPCGGGVCVDRHQGVYTLQYTQVPQPSTNLGLATTGDAGTGWVDIGTLVYGNSDGPGTNFNNTWQRHRYNFDPVNATGVRLVVPATGIGGGTAIDEIELYDVAGAFVPPPPPPIPVTITPESGFLIAWNGNDGDHAASTTVPLNAALASQGATAFSSSDLGPQLGIPFHVAANLNDGVYGNGNSWIGGDENPFAEAFAGVSLGSPQPIASIAWGRDNTGGFVDRWAGTYGLQFTQLAAADANTPFTGDPATGWATLGSVELGPSSVADGPGGNFTGFLRHEFEVATDDGPLMASAIRLVVPATGLGGGTAIDELEVYVVPEPGAGLLLGCGVLLLGGARRRRRRGV